MPPSDVARRFSTLDARLFESYRDATYSCPDFRLHLVDCWNGLRRAMDKRWFECPSSPHLTRWGKVDMAEYVLYDSPTSGDLHQVVPGKFVAFAGPRDLGGKLHDDARGIREFSPAYYLGIFRELGVSTVVRLNEAHYDGRAFAESGIEHHDLPFDDCTAPPADVVLRFCRIADAAPGLVAVHCRAGLGRTGTLVALWLMRTHGFAAREAMAWLRMVRPGSVIGEQQHYLCAVEPAIARMRARPAAARPLSAGMPTAELAVGAVEALWARIRGTVERLESPAAAAAGRDLPSRLCGPRRGGPAGLAAHVLEAAERRAGTRREISVSVSGGAGA